MLVEAKWCKKGYTPALKEYLDNGWLSSSGSVFLVHAFFATKHDITSDVVKALEDNHNLLYCSSMMFQRSRYFLGGVGERRCSIVRYIVTCVKQMLSNKKLVNTSKV